MARLVLCMLAFTLLAGCDSNGDKESGTDPQTFPNDGSLYSLEITGVQAEVAQGTHLNVVVQLKKDNHPLSDFKGNIEISLHISCGANKSQPTKQTVGADGRATFDKLPLDRKWSGKCSVKVHTKIFDDDLNKVKRFTILSAMVDGQDYPFSAFEAGKLTLHNCGEAVLFTQAGNAAPVRADSEGVTIDASNSTLFVINVSASGCELQSRW